MGVFLCSAGHSPVKPNVTYGADKERHVDACPTLFGVPEEERRIPDAGVWCAVLLLAYCTCIDGQSACLGSVLLRIKCS